MIGEGCGEGDWGRGYKEEFGEGDGEGDDGEDGGEYLERRWGKDQGK